MDRYLDALLVRRLGLSHWYQEKLAGNGVRFISDFYDRPVDEWERIFGIEEARHVDQYLSSMAMYDHLLKDTLSPEEERQAEEMERRAAEARKHAMAASAAASRQRQKREAAIDLERMLGR